MKRLALAGMAVLTLGLLAQDGQAHHGRRGGGGGDCAPAPVYAPAYSAPSCAMTVVWQEQEVVTYRPQYVTNKVKVKVNRLVTRQVKVPYTYYEIVTNVVPTKQYATVYRCVTEEQPYEYEVMVPQVTPRVIKQTFYTCVQQPVVTQVPVCQMVPTQCVDPCTGCAYTVCRPVTTVQNVTQYVSRMVASTRDVTVNVCNYVPQKQKGTRLVSRMVSEKQEYTVNVVQCNRVERKGEAIQYVCDTVQEEVEQPVTTCQMVQERVRVRVPVCVPVAVAPCPPPPCGY